MGYRKSMNVTPAVIVNACWLANLCVAIFFAALPGCRRDADQGSAAADKVTVYCSVDESFARGILDAFKATSGVDVAVVFDSEAGKTTGLVNRIRHEADAGRPRADVFWSSELFNTILLARRALLESYDSPAAADIPVRYRDTQHRWTAFAVRGRVIAFKSEGNETIALPTAWEELAKPEFARTTALPNPLFGTTRGHLAAMFALWGPERGRSFLTRIRENGVLIVDGNSAAVRSLFSGRCKIAATDTDDVWMAQLQQASRAGGIPIDLRYLDMGDGGTLLIPCSVAIVKGAPHPEAARRLVDYLVSAEVERLLAQSGSRNVPVRERLRAELGMAWPPETKVDFNAVADAMDEAAAAAREILLR